jgi:hypothetical protein
LPKILRYLPGGNIEIARAKQNTPKRELRGVCVKR